MQNDSNNGVVEKVPKQIGNHFNLIPGNSISAFTHLNKVYYQEEPFYSKQGSNVYTLRNKILNKPISKFIVSAINSVIGTIEYGKNTASRLKKYKIQLPTKNNKIDVDFIENFINEIEKEHISKLQKYITQFGFKTFKLTEKEKEILAQFRNDENRGGVEADENNGLTRVQWVALKLGDLFSITTYKKRFDANKVNISDYGEPYVVRTSVNNGIRGYIDEDKKFLNDGNTISFGQDTATVFYQKKPYFTGDKIKILKPKSSFFNSKNSSFFIASMTKSFSSFSWGSSSFSVKIINEQPIHIPVKDGKPDYETMETVISAIQKLVIKDVVLYVERKKKELNKLTKSNPKSTNTAF